MPKRIDAINPQIGRLEHVLGELYGPLSSRVVPAACRLLGLKTSGYYQIRRSARPPQATLRNLLHILLDILSPLEFAALLADPLIAQPSTDPEVTP